MVTAGLEFTFGASFASSQHVLKLRTACVSDFLNTGNKKDRDCTARFALAFSYLFLTFPVSTMGKNRRITEVRKCFGRNTSWTKYLMEWENVNWILSSFFLPFFLSMGRRVGLCGATAARKNSDVAKL